MGEWLLSRRDRLIVAWHEVPASAPTPKQPSRRVRCDRAGVPADSMIGVRKFQIPRLKTFTLDVGLAAPDHTVPYGTVLLRDAFPGTSCLATIMLSLRDKILSTAESLLKSSCGLPASTSAASTKFLANTLGLSPKSVLGNVQTPEAPRAWLRSACPSGQNPFAHRRALH
jgi:hypothetical protein